MLRNGNKMVDDRKVVSPGTKNIQGCFTLVNLELSGQIVKENQVLCNSKFGLFMWVFVMWQARHARMGQNSL